MTHAVGEAVLTLNNHQELLDESGVSLVDCAACVEDNLVGSGAKLMVAVFNFLEV